jgi:hypothetical protein
MPVTHKLVKLALRKQFLTADFSGIRQPGVIVDWDISRVEWEAETFTPPSDGVWFKEAYIPQSEILAATDLFELSGTYQIDVNGAVGKGAEFVEEVADVVKKLFKPSQPVTDVPNGIYIAVDRSERGPGRVERSVVSVGQNYPWWSITVSVNWRFYAPEQE